MYSKLFWVLPADHVRAHTSLKTWLHVVSLSSFDFVVFFQDLARSKTMQSSVCKFPLPFGKVTYMR